MKKVTIFQLLGIRKPRRRKLNTIFGLPIPFISKAKTKRSTGIKRSSNIKFLK